MVFQSGTAAAAPIHFSPAFQHWHSNDINEGGFSSFHSLQTHCTLIYNASLVLHYAATLVISFFCLSLMITLSFCLCVPSASSFFIVILFSSVTLFLHRVSSISTCSCSTLFSLLLLFFSSIATYLHSLPSSWALNPLLSSPLAFLHNVFLLSSPVTTCICYIHFLHELARHLFISFLPSTIDPHYSCVPLTYNMSPQWWLFLCLSVLGSLRLCELTWHLSPSSIVNETTLEVVDSQEINIAAADTTQWQLQGLEEGSLYRFHLSACTQAGCGPPLAQESNTVAKPRE